MTASIVAVHSNLKRYGDGDVSVTLDGSGTDRQILVIASSRSGGASVLTSCSIGAENAAITDNFVASSDHDTIVSIAVFTDAQHPGAGAATLTFDWASGAEMSAVVYELQGASQTAPFYSINSTVDHDGIVDTEVMTQNVLNETGKPLIMFFGAGDTSYFDSTITPSGNLSSLQISDNTYTHLYTAQTSSVVDADEDYSFTFGLTGGSAPGQVVYGAIAVNEPEANVDPALDTPHADVSIQTGQTGSIDFGSNFSDANVSDTLTFSISPDISLQTGWSWNSSTGVASYDGSQQVVAAADYTISASDGNGGTDATDVVSIEVTPPVFTVDTVSDSTPDVGSQITVDFSNAQGAITTSDFNIASQNASQVVIDIPDPTTLILSGQTYPTLPFSADVTIPLSDGSTSDDVVVQIQPETGYMYGEITDIHADGYYADVPGLATGMFAYARVTSGDVVFDVADGRGSAGAGGGTVEIQFYNGEWGDVATITYGEAGADTTAPVISLLGDPVVNINVGDPYNDAGATASDNIDGNITADIVIVNPVDVNTAGSYTITFNVSDAAGNAATEVTRTVNVGDTVAPAIYLIGAPSITLQQHEAYTEQGAIYLDNVDGSGNATVGGDTVNTAALGTYTVTYDYTDAAGNAAPQKTRLVTVTDQPVQAQSDKNDIIKRPIEVIIKLIIKQE